jgi:EAL domain-containing protein (putative c-di-GMP-specific phosphodiesterase class I)
MRPQPTEGAGPGLPRERFAAFAMAAAELMLTVDTEGRVLFQAGAMLRRRKLDKAIGRPARELVVERDRPAFDSAMARLAAEGRLGAMALHLLEDEGAPMALTGLVYAEPRGGAGPDRLESERRLALCFAALPPMALPEEPAGDMRDADALAREAERMLRATPQGGAANRAVLSLLEFNGVDGRLNPRPAVARRVTAALAEHGGGVAAQLGPGFFGLVADSDATQPSLGQVVERLQGILAGAGLNGARVTTAAVSLDESDHEGLTGPQAVRALRLALGTFARGGSAALAKAGFDGGLNGFVAAAGERAKVLSRAIADRRFSLAFQPIVELARPDDAPSHYEALIRPLVTEGLPAQGPQEFVTLVEMLGMSVQLDLAVLDATVQAISRAGDRVRVACNVSGLSLQDAEFRGKALDILASFPPSQRGRLLVEVTETAEIEHDQEARKTCEALRGQGISLCVDDFGAGAAGLNYLRLIQPSLVKLDGRFIESARGHAPGEQAAFATALVDLARATGAEVVAEKVETEADARLARSLGCRYGQGWLFGRPGALAGNIAARPFGNSARKAAEAMAGSPAAIR